MNLKEKNDYLYIDPEDANILITRSGFRSTLSLDEINDIIWKEHLESLKFQKKLEENKEFILNNLIKYKLI